MKTFLIIYLVVQFGFSIHWIYTMLTTEPMFKHDKSKFLSNWSEGGVVLLYIYLFLSVVISFVLSTAYLLLTFLEK